MSKKEENYVVLWKIIRKKPEKFTNILFPFRGGMHGRYS